MSLQRSSWEVDGLERREHQESGEVEGQQELDVLDCQAPLPVDRGEVPGTLLELLDQLDLRENRPLVDGLLKVNVPH